MIEEELIVKMRVQSLPMGGGGYTFERGRGVGGGCGEVGRGGSGLAGHESLPVWADDDDDEDNTWAAVECFCVITPPSRLLTPPPPLPLRRLRRPLCHLSLLIAVCLYA